MSKAKVETYRIRKSGPGWFVTIYEGWSLTKPIKDYGPYDFAGADAKAKELDIPDGDKGPDMADVRGHNVQR